MGFVAESTTTFTERANEFKMEGVFDREIGDLVMKVCCKNVNVTSLKFQLTSLPQVALHLSFHLCLIVH